MLLISIAGFNGCKSTSDPSGWDGKKVDKWFSSGEWLGGCTLIPDSSVNRRELAESYYGNSERWKDAFRFLSEKDLAHLEPGRYDIDGDNLYATISNYMTKDPDSAYFEAHRKYIDIQYVISGKEIIGIAKPVAAKDVITPYDTTRDIEFLTVEKASYRLATPHDFFIFFPDDLHKPGLKDSISSPVTKLVIKLRMD